MRRFAFLSAVLAAAALAQHARADEAPANEAKAAPERLTIGDKAPDIDIEHWVKGVEMDKRGKFEPLTTWEPGQVYLLEFWATWCPPCVGSMPHLSELQEKHAKDGFRVIGVSDESLPKVVEFLFKTYERDGKVHNDRTHYTLTTDPDGSTHASFFRAAGQRGIPCGFVIGKTGEVEWIGHPMRVDDVLEQVIAGTWDREAFKTEFEEKRRLDELRTTFNAAYRPLRQAGDWEGCWKVLEEQGAELPNLEMERAHVLLVGLKRADEGYAILKEHAEASKESPQGLNRIAWWIVDTKDLEPRDLDLAQSLAEKACELAEHKDPSILDTLAHVHHARGELDKAIELQTKAVELAAGNERLQKQMVKVLETWKAEAEEAGADAGSTVE
ncbi:MAG: redoxin family protein [Planctomycetota bacterium]